MRKFPTDSLPNDNPAGESVAGDNLDKPFETISRSGRTSILIALVLGGILTIWMEWPVLGNVNSRVVGGIADTYQYVWYLGWFWHAVHHGLNPFFSHEINFPHGFGLMYNTSVIAESALFGWLVPYTSPVFVYNLVFSINVVLVVLLGQMLLRELGARAGLSIWGGLMFGIMPYLTAQDHGHVSQYFISPVLAILLLVARVVNRRTQKRRIYGTVVGLMLAVEFYTSLELIATGALSTAILIGFVAVAKRGRVWLRHRFFGLSWAFWLPVLGVSFVLVIPGLWEFWLTGGMHFAGRPLHPQTGTMWATDLASPLVPEPWLVLHSALTNHIFKFKLHGSLEEEGSYIGLALIVFSGLFYNVWRSVFGRSLFWFSVTMFVLSLGNQVHILGKLTPIPLPWHLFSRVPMLDSALPIRLSFFVDLSLIIWITLSLDTYLRSSSARKSFRTLRTLAVGVVALSSLALWMPKGPYMSTKVYHLPARVVAAVRGEPVAEITPNFGYDMQALASANYEPQVVNMYGFAPKVTVPGMFSPGFFVIPPNASVREWSRQIRVVERIMKRGYIVYPPFNPHNQPTPLNLRRAIADTLGPPDLQVQGCRVWRFGQTR